MKARKLAQFDLARTSYGSKQAALSTDVRGPSTSHILLKTIVSKMCDLSVARFRGLVSSGFVLMLPANVKRQFWSWFRNYYPQRLMFQSTLQR